MTFDELKQMIVKDLKIDETALDRESANTPQLHNKYLVMFMDEKMKLNKLKNDLSSLRTKLWLYYTGRMDKDQLAQLGWEPFELNILKTEADDLIESDERYFAVSDRVKFQEEKVNYLESVIKIINNRQWQIRAMIDWVKFTQGA